VELFALGAEKGIESSQFSTPAADGRVRSVS
jgi:hypothetical protein